MVAGCAVKVCMPLVPSPPLLLALTFSLPPPLSLAGLWSFRVAGFASLHPMGAQKHQGLDERVAAAWEELPAEVTRGSPGYFGN